MRRVGATGRLVRPRSRMHKLLVFLWERLGGLWRWREFTIPFAFVYAAWAGGGAAALAVLAVLGGAAVLVLVIPPAAVLGAPARCMGRSRAFARQRRWPRLCVGLHWYRKLDKGTLLVPALLSWEEHGGQVTVRLRPLPEHA